MKSVDQDIFECMSFDNCHNSLQDWLIFTFFMRIVVLIVDYHVVTLSMLNSVVTQLRGKVRVPSLNLYVIYTALLPICS